MREEKFDRYDQSILLDLADSLIAERYFFFLISSIQNMKKVTSFKNHPVQLVTHYYLEKIGTEKKGHVFIARQKDVAFIEKMGIST